MKAICVEGLRKSDRVIIIILMMIISRYSDGYFDVVIKAANSPDPSKADFALIKIFVLQDTDLMKFVFDKNPVSVAKQMREFKTEIEAAFAQVLS